MKTPTQRWVIISFFVLAMLGFLLPLWPLSVLGVALLSLWGRWFFAIFLGLLLDLAWGAPVGTAHWLYFPFVWVALLAALVRLFSLKYFINRGVPERL